MPYDLDPIAETWYTSPELDQDFKVVAVDDHTRSVEIQYFDGDLDEFDFDSWRQLNLEVIAPPEDWMGPMDNVQPDEWDYEGAAQPTEWSPEDFKQDDSKD